MRSVSLLLTCLIFALLSWTGPPTACAYDPMCEFYEEHNGACCSDCHDMVSCATTNLFCVPSPISTPNSGEKSVVYDSINSQVKGTQPYDGVCEVCHTRTRYHRNNVSGDHTHCADKRCTSCHLHGPTTMVSKAVCYTCHGGSPGDVPAGNPPMFTTPGVQSHLTHKNAARGPQFGDVGDDPGCTGCHKLAAGGGVFADGKPFATTGACDNCHSDGGAVNGVTMAKANWDAGIYETDGTLKSGKEQWCTSCHDADRASSNQDGSGEAAPDIIANNSTYGYYVTGHGRVSEYPLMYYQGGSGNGNPGANLACIDCHDSSSTHLNAGQSVSRLKSGYDNDQSNSNCNQCHPPGTSATAAPELYTNSGEYEAAGHASKLCTECHDVHGMVAGAYPAMAINGARALCLSCHNGTDAPSASEPPAAHGESSVTLCVDCHDPHHPAHDGADAGADCNSCHGHDAGTTDSYYRHDPLMDYVPQETGIYDTTYSHLEESDCRSCHGASLAARHHYSQRVLCPECYPPGESGCTYCHPVESPPGYFPKGDPSEYEVGIRMAHNCLAEECHPTAWLDPPPDGHGWHHCTEDSESGNCVACHNPNLIAPYSPVGSFAENEPHVLDMVPTPFTCHNCHGTYLWGQRVAAAEDREPTGNFDPDNPAYEDAGHPSTYDHFNAWGVPVGYYEYGKAIRSIKRLHHMETQGNVYPQCYMCHSSTGSWDDISWDPCNPELIRACESCHTKETLHAIHEIALPDISGWEAVGLHVPPSNEDPTDLDPDTYRLFTTIEVCRACHSSSFWRGGVCQ